MMEQNPPASLDPGSLVARIIAELQANPDAQRLLLRALLTNEFLGLPARLDRIEKEVAELRAEMNRRFEQVDQRFEQVDQRFEQVDQRFEQVDRRFEQVDQRFEQVDRRFEQMDRRFEQMDQRFEQMDRRFEQMDQRFEQAAETMSKMDQKIDRLGSRWGIQVESVFRKTMATVLEKSFGVRVEPRTIAGEQFDLLIYDHEHILVEFAASVGRNIRDRMERKRRLYEAAAGVRPTRVILATASIYSRRAEDLRNAGIEVVEPEEPPGEVVE